MPLNRPHAPFLVACCLRDAAAAILADEGLRVPERGHPTHRADDGLECAGGEGLWVTQGITVPAAVVVPDPCTNVFERVFTVELNYPTCNEGIVNCDPDPGCEPDVNGCYVVDEAIGDGDCQDPGTRPNVIQETAYAWHARYALEVTLPEAARCCLQDCAGMRCESARLIQAETLTQGSVIMTTLAIGLSW